MPSRISAIVLSLAVKVMRVFIDTPVSYLISILPRSASFIAETSSARHSRRNRFFHSTEALTLSRSFLVFLAASVSSAKVGAARHRTIKQPIQRRIGEFLKGGWVDDGEIVCRRGLL